MKLTRLALVALGLVLVVAPTTAGDEKPWFDLANCAMCKNLGAEEGLIENIDWETHKISNGMVTVTLIPAEWEEAFQRAHANMQAVVAKMEGGEQMHLCGFCMSYGSLMMSGAKMENFEGEKALVGLVTSNDAEVVEAIHAHADRTLDEYKKWMAEQEAAKGGHQ